MGVVGVAQRALGCGFGLQPIAIVVGGIAGGSARVGHGQPRARRIVGEAHCFLAQSGVGNLREQPVQRVIAVGRSVAVEVRFSSRSYPRHLAHYRSIYAQNNPVNAVDPSGRNDNPEYSILVKGDIEALFAARRVGAYARCAYGVQGYLLKRAISGIHDDLFSWLATAGLGWGCSSAFGLLP